MTQALEQVSAGTPGAAPPAEALPAAGQRARAATKVPALEVANLGHAFKGRKVLDGVGFALQPGDQTILLGLNGAGKTTLFALITRLYHAHHGRIAVFGTDIAREPTRALARIGVVFQQPTLDLDLTIEQNLFYHAALHGLSRKAARLRIEDEMARAGLSSRRRERVRVLSGGQRRRVELARALVHDPQLLLLDEPTVGLDIESRQFMLDHVRKLCSERRLAVLWATHLIDEAHADARVIVLHRGRVLADGPAPEVAGGPQGGGLAAAFERLTRGAAG